MLRSTVLEGQIQDLAQEPYQWPPSSVSFGYFNFDNFLGVDSTKVNVANKLKWGLVLEKQRGVHGTWERLRRQRVSMQTLSFLHQSLLRSEQQCVRYTGGKWSSHVPRIATWLNFNFYANHISQDISISETHLWITASNDGCQLCHWQGNLPASLIPGPSHSRFPQQPMTHVLGFLFADKDTEPAMGRENRKKVADFS